MDPHTRILGIPLAAPLSGKDTAEGLLIKARPNIAIIHMSTLLQVIIQRNERYQKIVQEGGLLPPEEAVKGFRCGFLGVTKGLESHELPHIFGNGPCRDEYEALKEIEMVHRVRPHCYQFVGFRFLLDREHIKARAAERAKQATIEGKKPRPDDLGNTPVSRYDLFHKNLGPVLKVFEKKKGIIVDINANETPEQVLSQIVSVYDSVTLPALVR